MGCRAWLPAASWATRDLRRDREIAIGGAEQSKTVIDATLFMPGLSLLMLDTHTHNVDHTSAQLTQCDKHSYTEPH